MRETENREEERICLAKHRDEMIINGMKEKGEGEKEGEKYRVTRAAM